MKRSPVWAFSKSSRRGAGTAANRSSVSATTRNAAAVNVKDALSMHPAGSLLGLGCAAATITSIAVEKAPQGCWQFNAIPRVLVWPAMHNPKSYRLPGFVILAANLQLNIRIGYTETRKFRRPISAAGVRIRARSVAGECGEIAGDTVTPGSVTPTLQSRPAYRG